VRPEPIRVATFAAIPDTASVRSWVGAFLVTVVLAAAAVPVAGASQLIDRDASDVQLLVNAKGEALLSYRAHGVEKHVLAWGAVDALPATAAARQLRLRLDYSGGWGKYFLADPDVRALQAHYRRIRFTPGYLVSPTVKKLSAASAFARNYWKTSFRGSCGKYDGPPLAWLLTACKAPDGSYWAVQAWQRELPNYGQAPTPAQAAWELRLSHWTGDLPVLTVHTDWSWRQWDHLYGTFTYRGLPVYGFVSTRAGAPLDDFGRNVYVDTLDSAYGAGWRRENSFLTHRGTGVFCYSVNPHPGHPAGTGTEYRATVIGPGVTPDVTWQGAAPGQFDASADALANQAIAALGDAQCRPN
jgi:hypothetical protein